MTRRSVAPALLCTLAACNVIFGIHEGSPLGTGGAGGASSSTTGTGGAPNEDAGDASPDDAGAVSLEGCVLLLRFDEASFSGPGAVKDSSGQDNHGTVTGSVVPTPDGKIGGAAQFDGSSYVVVPSSPSLQPTTALTYAAWAYPTALNGGVNGFSPGVLSKRLMYMSNVAFTLFFWDQNHAFADVQNMRVQSNASFSNLAWHHLAVVYDALSPDPNMRLRFYVNGALDATSTADPMIAPNNEPLRVGDLPGGGNMFQGKIDEVVVWTRALSAQEIKDLYDNKGFF